MVAGMSSDESDSELVAFNPVLLPHRPKYQVTSPVWRNPQLHRWLRIFGLLHIAGRRSKGASVGSWPHNCHRQSKPKPSLSVKFVSELPINAYNASWLAARNDIQWIIQPHETEYDFTHNDAIYACVLSDANVYLNLTFFLYMLATSLYKILIFNGWQEGAVGIFPLSTK
jgi:hypothetical protein